MKKIKTLPLSALGVLMVLTLTGCGSSSATPGNLLSGNVEERPSMETLPTTDIPRDRFTEKMQFAWLLAEQTFELPRPAVPTGGTAQEIQEWTEHVLQAWLAQKNRMVEAARAELDSAASQSHRQRIVAGAVVGLMYEDVAIVIRDVPLPSELDDEPEIQDVYRDVVAFQAEPYVRHARRAYDACARNAREPMTMRHWSSFCRGRSRNLATDGGLVEGLDDPVGQTTVEVYRE